MSRCILLVCSIAVMAGCDEAETNARSPGDPRSPVFRPEAGRPLPPPSVQEAASSGKNDVTTNATTTDPAASAARDSTVSVAIMPEIKVPAKLLEKLPVAFLQPNGYISLGREVGLSAAEEKSVSATLFAIWNSAVQWQMKAAGELELSLGSKVAIPRLPDDLVVKAVRQCWEGVPSTVSGDTKSLITALFRRQFESEFNQEVHLMLSKPKDGFPRALLNGEAFPNPALKGHELMVQYGDAPPRRVNLQSGLNGMRFGFIKFAPELR